MATLDEIQALLERIWKHLPSSGNAGSPWTVEEKTDAISSMQKLVARAGSLKTNQERFAGEIDEKFSAMEGLLKDCEKLLDQIKKDVLNDQLGLVVELLSTQMRSEDLDRILGERVKSEDPDRTLVE